MKWCPPIFFVGIVDVGSSHDELLTSLKILFQNIYYQSVLIGINILLIDVISSETQIRANIIKAFKSSIDKRALTRRRCRIRVCTMVTKHFDCPNLLRIDRLEKWRVISVNNFVIEDFGASLDEKFCKWNMIPVHSFRKSTLPFVSDFVDFCTILNQLKTCAERVCITSSDNESRKSTPHVLIKRKI